MNLRRLKYFVKIVDIGSLTQAASAAYRATCAEPAGGYSGRRDGSAIIDSYQTRRHANGSRKNSLYHARTILRQCEQAQLAVNNVGQTLSGHVSIGLAPGTAASSITMPLLQAVRAELPEVLVYLHENSGSVLNDKLLNGQLDMAVLYDRSPVAGITSQPSLKEDSPRGHPRLSGAERRSYRRGRNEPLSAA